MQYVSQHHFCRIFLVVCLTLLGMVYPLTVPQCAPVTLLVATAADVAAAMKDMGAQFTNATGINLQFHVGASGQLAQQIAQGAPVDLFAAANVAFIDSLEQQGRIVPGSKALYARGRLILWWLPDRTQALAGLADLRRPDISRIALANPIHAPYGMAARQALQNAGLWEQLQSKLVLGENVLQAFHYAATGNVAVAVVAYSLHNQQPGQWLLVPEALHAPLIQTLAVIQGSQHVPEAQQLARYITGPEGQAVLQRYGFFAPSPEHQP